MVRKRGNVMSSSSSSEGEQDTPPPRKPAKKATKSESEMKASSRKKNRSSELDNTTTTEGTSEPPAREGTSLRPESGDHDPDEGPSHGLRQTAEPNDPNDDELEEARQPLRSLEELLDVDIPPLPVHSMKTDGTGKRLIISKIINENFKSYKGRHVIGPFHTNFTSIVGPNGSGKSNVIDSILFVFGFKASKMRFKKMSEVIHSGEPRPRYCTVEIHFEEIIDKPDGGFESCPGTELEVRRTANMDNSSSYYLNGRKTNYKQVAVALKGRGIDLDHNRFLILQGEVEQIAQMQPKAQKEGDTDGMLEYLEDIIGSSRLKIPLEQLNSNMEELSEQRTEKLNRLKLAEKEKSDLEGPRNEAIAFLKDENKLARKNHRLAQIHLLECKKNVDGAKINYDEVKLNCKEKEAKLQQLKSDIDERKKATKAVKKRVEEAEKGRDAAKEEFNELEAQNMKLNEEGKNSNKKIEALKKEIVKLEKQIADTESRPERLAKETEKLRELLEESKEKREVYQAEHEEAMAKVPKATENSEKKKDEFQQQLIAMQAKVGEAKNKTNMAQGALDLRLQDYEKEKARLTEMQRKLEDTSANFERAQKTVEETEKMLPQEQRALNTAIEMVRALEQREGNLRIQVEEKKAKVQDVKGAMKESQSTNRTLNALLAEKRAGRIPGIFGRLGDLGTIEKEYDVAVSTACGPLDNVVVDTSETAVKCVDFLKATNNGRTVFLPIDVMTKKHGQAISQPFRGPNDATRLFDLIVPEHDRFLPCFYHGLKDTLVVENIDEATRVGLNGPRRYRVVTMDGKMVETSGQMSGGGGKPASGRMGATSKRASRYSMSDNEMRAMEQTIHDLTKDLDAARKEKYEVATSIEKLEKTVADLSTSKKTAEMELKAFEKQKKTYEEGLAPLRKKVDAKKPSEEELETLRASLEEAKTQYDGYSREEKKVQDEVDKLDAEIASITKDIAGNVAERLQKIIEDIENHERTIVKNRTTIKNTGRQVDKLKDKLESSHQELADAKEAKQNAKKKGEELVESGAELARKAKAFEEEFAKATEEYETLRDGMKETEKEEQALGVEFIKLRTELGKASDTVKKYEQKKLGQENKLESLSLHDLEKIVGKKKPDRKENEEETRMEVDEEEGNVSTPLEAEESFGPETSRRAVEEGEEDEWSMEFKFYSEEELSAMNPHDINFEITSLMEALAKRKPNISVIEEYRKKEARYEYCLEEHQKVCRLRDRVKDKYEQLRKQRYKEFQTGFMVISLKLKEMYQMITLGGDAELEFVDTLDPFADGISFTVRPPKKSWKQISNLSGGERTLSSLALVFALHHYKPTPLYVMDEIDAALDFKNVSIIAHYIKDRTKNAQFIIISLRNNMFELADRLVGIYKTYNSTKHVVVNPERLALQPAAGSQPLSQPQSVASQA